MLVSTQLLGANPVVVRVVEKSTDIWSQLGIAAAGALLGAAIALAGERLLRWLADRGQFRALMRVVKTEIEMVHQEAEERREKAERMRQQGPLPTEGWRAFLASGLSGRLNAADLEKLLSFYRLVETANYLAALAPIHLQTASLAADPIVRQVFEEEAERVARAPFADVSAQAAEAAEVAGRHGGVTK